VFSTSPTKLVVSGESGSWRRTTGPSADFRPGGRVVVMARGYDFYAISGMSAGTGVERDLGRRSLSCPRHVARRTSRSVLPRELEHLPGMRFSSPSLQDSPAPSSKTFAI